MRGKLVLALVGVAMLAATTVSADHTQFSYSLTNSAAGANSDGTADVDFGTAHPASGTTHLDSGFLVAHANNSTSPLSPPPEDGDTVGEGTARARWWATFCSTQTMSFTAKWKEPIDSGAPSGAVAQINLVTSLGFTVKSFVVKVGSGGDSYIGGEHYDLVVPDFGNNTCSSGTVETSLTTYGTVPGSSPARLVSQNPSSAGDYDVWSVYTDKSSNNHETHVVVEIT